MIRLVEHHIFIPGISLLFFILFSASLVHGKTYSVFSPHKKIEVKIQVDQAITYSVNYQSNPLINWSPISMALGGGRILGRNSKIKNIKENTVNKVIPTIVSEKRSDVVDYYNEIILNFGDDYGLIVRAYNDGFAYRFVTHFGGKVKVVSEQASFNFPDDFSVYFPEAESFHMSFENTYSRLALSEIGSEKMGS